MAFLHGQLALLLGAVALSLTIVLRRFAKDERLREDVFGAMGWFAIFVVVRGAMVWGEAVSPKEWHPLERAVWMLAFAFGSVRLVVALTLWLRRRLGAAPTAKIHRDVVDFLLYLATAIPILKTQLALDVTTLLGTSAVLSLVLGFALQDTLGNVFSGLSLQLDRPYQVGDFIRVGPHEGRVVQTSWRSTRIETLRKEQITLPNALTAKEPIVNFTCGGRPVAIDLTVGAAYAAPPTKVKTEILEALAESPLVLKTPAPWVRTWEFEESSLKYVVRLWIDDWANVPHVHDEVFARLWYRFGRAGIEIPFPQRVVTMRTETPRLQGLREELLGELDLFKPFTAVERKAIADAGREHHFGLGEAICVEGREGQTFYVVVSGRVSVRVGQPPREVATLSRGQYFGEMSLLTGDPRAATVVAIDDTMVLEFGRSEFQRFFTEKPELAEQLADFLARRKAELAAGAAGAALQKADAAGLLTRLRRIFSP
ncbi:MAG: mechanosensitive ion channel [Myxococcaceae bacterium]|nr:mechanosensitive ion channel [Myxococcaceae bacterium]